jgi:hypothetical protein
MTDYENDHHADDDGILEYETEAPPAPVPDAPIPVDVCGMVTTVATVPQHATCYTRSLSTASNPVDQILPYDPLRVRATVIVNDYPVVLCHSQPSAQDASNAVASTPSPDGAYVFASATASSTVIITSVAPVWAAATFNQTSRVSVIVERRSA